MADGETERHKESSPDKGREQHAGNPAADLVGSVSDTAGLVGLGTALQIANHPQSRGRGNGPVRQAAIQRLQQTYGNRAVQRMLQESGSLASPAPVQRVPATPGDGGGVSAPSVADPSQHQQVENDAIVQAYGLHILEVNALRSQPGEAVMPSTRVMYTVPAESNRPQNRLPLAAYPPVLALERDGSRW